jgi:hypothetical protein
LEFFHMRLSACLPNWLPVLPHRIKNCLNN